MDGWLRGRWVHDAYLLRTRYWTTCSPRVDTLVVVVAVPGPLFPPHHAQVDDTTTAYRLPGGCWHPSPSPRAALLQPADLLGYTPPPLHLPTIYCLLHHSL